MSAPIWMASPPEVHAALLTSGPGPGSLLAAAAQWSLLSGEYGAVAAELSAVLAEVAATAWQGPSGAEYLAAHGPYLAWLEQAAIDSAATAAQHEITAAAYSTALATMPTVAELAANKLSHGLLLATNFLGINTIPIAVNEADYLRMWIQAAVTMTAYQSVAEAAVAAAPSAPAAPRILTADAPAAQRQDLTGRLEQVFGDISDFIADPYSHFLEFFTQQGLSPETAIVLAGIALLAYDVLWWPYYASYSLLLLPFFAPALSALSALSALGLLLNTPGGPLPADAASTDAGTGRAADTEPAAAAVPAPTAGGASAGTGAPSAPATSAAGAGAPSSAPPGPFYAVGGLTPPRIGAGPRTGTRAVEEAAAELADTAAASAALRTRTRARRTARGRSPARGDRREKLDVTADADMTADACADSAGAPTAPAPPAGTTAGTTGAGRIGTGGARPAPAAQPAGLTTLPDGGHTESLPLLPSSWAEATDPEPGGTIRGAGPTLSTEPPK